MDTPNLSGPRTNTDTSPGLKKRGRYQDIDSPEIIAPFDFLIPASFSETHSPWAILDEASAVISPEDPHTRESSRQYCPRRVRLASETVNNPDPLTRIFLPNSDSLVFALPCLPFNPCFVCQFTSKRKTILAARQDEPSLARDNPPTPIQFNPPRSISKSALFRTSLRLFIFTTSKPIIVNSIIVTISIGRITCHLTILVCGS
ncbi:Serine/threonine-protein kinase svkA [Fusarium oxysporum f. sp. albedinis]|nr:Serine/threonine-protein kinase svkA [Fusarium oxysporum f. sp. albedinis]